MIAIIDKGEYMVNLGYVDAYVTNAVTGTVELFKSPTENKTVNTCKHKVILKRRGIAWAVIKDGRFVG